MLPGGGLLEAGFRVKMFVGGLEDLAELVGMNEAELEERMDETAVMKAVIVIDSDVGVLVELAKEAV